MRIEQKGVAAKKFETRFDLSVFKDINGVDQKLLKLIDALPPDQREEYARALFNELLRIGPGTDQKFKTLKDIPLPGEILPDDNGAGEISSIRKKKIEGSKGGRTNDIPTAVFPAAKGKQTAKRADEEGNETIVDDTSEEDLLRKEIEGYQEAIGREKK